MSLTRINTSPLCLLFLTSILLGVTTPLTASVPAPKQAHGTELGPVDLRCDSLVQPLGVDSPAPVFSWRTQDGRRGAKQTAYQITLSTSPTDAREMKGLLWDSKRVESATSIGIKYGGPKLQPTTRYYWTVKIWDQNGRLYPASGSTWFETGLMQRSNWHARWIGYESEQLSSVRNGGAKWITNAPTGEEPVAGDNHHQFRTTFSPHGPVKKATLYATGEDTVGVWIDGKPVLPLEAETSWKQSPWGTYRSVDATALVSAGKNVIAIDVVHFGLKGAATPSPKTTPMSMTLLLEYSDGKREAVVSRPDGWKATLNAKGDWTLPSYSDTSWSLPQIFEQTSPMSGPADVGRPWPTGPVVGLRHTFDEHLPIKSARLYATALGAYKFHVNGVVVGDQILSPGWTDYRERVTYQAYDVTKDLRQGKNTIAALLAPGWYSSPLMWFKLGNNYGSTQPALMAQLRIEHTDGTIEWIATDESWAGKDSATIFAEIYDGETEDARLQERGWDTPQGAIAGWKPVALLQPTEPQIVSQFFPPIRAEKVISAKSVTSPSAGVYVYDFGQEFAGVPHVRLSGKAGQDVRLRFAEVLNADGSVYVENLRTAKATDHYIFSGRTAVETFQPQFTYHGFRYMEISGVTAEPQLKDVQAVVIHTDAAFTSKLETGNDMVNKLWNIVLWGQRSNIMSVPTDCPQRDERLGWSADAQVFWRTASFNMDLSTFGQKYATDLRGTQAGTPMFGIFAPGVFESSTLSAAGWSDAGVIVPWTTWIQSGNQQLIEDNWGAMASYLSEIAKENPDDLWRHGFGIPFGDWLTPTLTTPEDLVATAYWAYDVSLMKQMAEATGRTSEATAYERKYEEIRTAFQKAYVHQDGFVGATNAFPTIPPPTAQPDTSASSGSDPGLIETQTGYVLALHMNLIPLELRREAGRRLVEKIAANGWRLGTGFLGTPYLLEVLSDTGHSDVAYRLLLNTEYPSWGYLVTHGATTTWERWNGDLMKGDPSMNSYNHYAYGAVAEWIYRYAAGVDTDSSHAGFQRTHLHPNFDQRLGHLEFQYSSPYGEIRSAWTISGDRVVWRVTIPANTTAILTVPETNARDYTLGGVPLASIKEIRAINSAEYEIPSGSYIFGATMHNASGPSQ